VTSVLDTLHCDRVASIEYRDYPRRHTMNRSPELEKLIVDWFDAATRGDPSMVDRHVSRDEGTRLVGSDPDEWFEGASAAEYLRKEVEGSGGNVRSTADTEAFTEGTVGWAMTRLTLTFPDGSSISPRWSAVFHQEDGEWKFVQLHASIGVPNEEAGWVLRG
jgi:SnoaL-like protein